jgi:hypothetical protein
VVESILSMGHKSHEVIEMIKLMQNEVERVVKTHKEKNIPLPERVEIGGSFKKPENGYMDDGREEVPDKPTGSAAIILELNYFQLFEIFVTKRKIKLLRFLFA